MISSTRLEDDVYSEPNSTTPFNNNFNESLTYDLNGNISTLKRNAFPISGNTSTLVDDLIYEYTGNRLTKVRETALNNTGYEGGNNVIAYDLNGNMTDMKDKGIQSINYNYLNLSNQLSITQINPLGKVSNTNINYLYRADGTKLRKTYNNTGDMGASISRMTDYLDGFQYSYEDNGNGMGCITCRTEVAYEAQAYKKGIIGGPLLPTMPEWKLSFVPTTEGFYSFAENRYIYQYKDHLGNARVSFAKNSAGILQTTDTNNFYPFGLSHIGGSAASNFGNYYSYKNSGKELQETGFYDYGWRQYMPDIARWNGMDQLSEKYISTSPYANVANNPVSYADIDGRWFAEDGSIINTSGQTYGFLGSSHKPSYATNYLGQGLGDTRGYTPFGETKAYATLMDALQTKKPFSINNGYMSYWTDGAAGKNSIINGEMEIAATGLVGHRVKIDDKDFFTNLANNQYFSAAHLGVSEATSRFGAYALTRALNPNYVNFTVLNEFARPYIGTTVAGIRMSSVAANNISKVAKYGGGVVLGVASIVATELQYRDGQIGETERIMNHIMTGVGFIPSPWTIGIALGYGAITGGYQAITGRSIFNDMGLGPQK